MSAAANFNLVLSTISKALSDRGFRRKGAWFTRRPEDGSLFWCINVRKIPQAASKRIVFQVVSYAGHTAAGDKSPIGSLEQALDHSVFEHRIIEGNAEKYWTVWPSSDPAAIGEQVNAHIASQSIEALEKFTAEPRPAGGN